jgi:endonuclease YncB( thermonuclease family)
MAYKETGIMKKFVWTMLDGVGLTPQSEEYKMGMVTNVVDGDTFDIQLGEGKTERVRLLLVDTPETEKENQPYQPLANEGREYLQEALFSKDAKLYFDTDKEDVYGRTLAYVEVEGKDINKGLLEEGHAQYSFEFNDSYKRGSSYQEAEGKAYESGKGIWGIKDYAQPSTINKRDKFNTMYDTVGYSDARKRKLGEVLRKKETINTNKSSWDNVLERLK